MGLTLPYAFEERIESKATTLRIPNRIGFAFLKAKQLMCSHNWEKSRNVNLYSNLSLEVSRCCKCKMKKINPIEQ